jgi:uncharacterized protein DUF6924
MTKPLPQSSKPLIVRTDFSDANAWQRLRDAIQSRTDEGFAADVEVVDRSEYDGLTSEQLLSLLPETAAPVLFVADAATLSGEGGPVLAIGVTEERGRMFRVIASELWLVENNLSLANMEFAEFLQAAQDGIFRGWAS